MLQLQNICKWEAMSRGGGAVCDNPKKMRILSEFNLVMFLNKYYLNLQDYTLIITIQVKMLNILEKITVIRINMNIWINTQIEVISTCCHF